MRAFKNKCFSEWAKSEGISDEDLSSTLKEMDLGLTGDKLGNSLYKKRVAVNGRGKSGGNRFIVTYRKNDKAFFLIGYAKNDRENIDDKELKALKLLSKHYTRVDDEALERLLKDGSLIQIKKR